MRIVSLHQEPDLCMAAIQKAEQRQIEEKLQSEWQDLSLDGIGIQRGSRHPLTKIERKCMAVLRQLGFELVDGPEVDNAFHNFDALNIPEHHPARDMQDTFWVTGGLLLRSHTTTVQARVLSTKPELPIRVASMGRVYRNEAISSRAHCFFHQIEGLYIDKDVSFADMKKTLLYFTKSMFGDEAKIRLRPSYFPFTEPSAEVDVSCTICNGKGCNVCKYSGWLEIMGCGMVDPNVLENCNINPEIYSGYAFGMGVERIAQLVYQVNDLRLYSENDWRFLKQFSSESF